MNPNNQSNIKLIKHTLRKTRNREHTARSSRSVTLASSSSASAANARRLAIKNEQSHTFEFDHKIQSVFYPSVANFVAPFREIIKQITNANSKVLPAARRTPDTPPARAAQNRNGLVEYVLRISDTLGDTGSRRATGGSWCGNRWRNRYNFDFDIC